MKRFFFILFFILIFLFSVDFCSGVYFSPSKEPSFYRFVPYLTINRSYFVGSSNDKPAMLEVDVFGPQDLDEYITTEPEKVTGMNQVILNLGFPESIEPGNYLFVVCATNWKEKNVEGDSEGIQVSGRICERFKMLATFPGKNLIINSFSVKNVDVEATYTPISFSVSNWGDEDILSVYGGFEVFDIAGEKITSVVSAPFYLESTKTVQTFFNLSTQSMRAGQYLVKGKIYWDGNIDELNETYFSVGSAAFQILNITKEFYVGEINDLFIFIKNDFGAMKDNIYLNIEVAGQSMDLPAFNMEPFSVKPMKTFLDARNLGVGIYEAKVTILVDDSITEESFLFEVKEKPMSLTPFYVGGGLILIVLFIISIFVVLKKRGKRYEKAQIL